MTISNWLPVSSQDEQLTTIWPWTPPREAQLFRDFKCTAERIVRLKGDVVNGTMNVAARWRSTVTAA